MTQRETFDRRSNLRKPRREIVAVACEQTDAVLVTPGNDAETIVLDFVNPIGSVRRFLRWAG